VLQFEIQSLKEDVEHQISVAATLKKIIGAEVLESSPIAACEVRSLGSKLNFKPGRRQLPHCFVGTTLPALGLHCSDKYIVQKIPDTRVRPSI
jgi:hypothetical protein